MVSSFVVRNERNEEISEGEYRDTGYLFCKDNGEIFNVENSENFQKVDDLDTICGADGTWTKYNLSWKCWSGWLNFVEINKF